MFFFFFDFLYFIFLLYRKIELTKKNIPNNYSITMGDFINKLLKRNAEERLGYKNIDEIINHPWLEGVDWEIIESKLYDSDYIPFIPSIEDNFDIYNAHKKDNIYIEKYDEYLKRINDFGYFDNYYFNYYTLNTITKCKVIYEKASILQKYIISTDGRKSSPDQSEVELNNKEISKETKNNISFNINSEFNSEIDKNESYIENEPNFPRKTKSSFIKSNRILKRKIIGFEKRELNDNKEDKSF